MLLISLREQAMQLSGSENSASEPAGRFDTTHWSVVRLAGDAQSSESLAALEKLCRAYWHPIYVFARRKGRTEEDAKDLTQHFFYNLLERRDFSGLDPRKGKFRTFLLTAFSHFMANDYDRAKASKRGGGSVIVSLDEYSEDLSLHDPAAGQSAAMSYDLQWARSIVKNALESLKQEMTNAGKGGQFGILKSFLTTEAVKTDYTSAATKLGMADTSIPVLVHRMRQRYRQLVREQVAQTVTSPTELDEEMRYLFDVLNQ